MFVIMAFIMTKIKTNVIFASLNMEVLVINALTPVVHLAAMAFLILELYVYLALK